MRGKRENVGERKNEHESKRKSRQRTLREDRSDFLDSLVVKTDTLLTFWAWTLPCLPQPRRATFNLVVDILETRERLERAK